MIPPELEMAVDERSVEYKKENAFRVGLIAGVIFWVVCIVVITAVCCLRKRAATLRRTQEERSTYENLSNAEIQQNVL